jgi:ubiquitin-activating enzyme E1-like protein
MSSVVQANNTYARIELLVRRLTALSSESALPSSEIQTQTNTFYSADFPYAIKLDQMRDIYTFYTQPNIDRYPLDVNYNQGVRAPIYIDGIQGFFYKDRDEFYRIWPQWPTMFNQYGASSLFGAITAATQADPCQITSPNNGLSTGDTIYIYSVGGMTELNGNTYTVTVVDSSNFTIGIDSTSYTAYTSGGSWSVVPVVFSFTLPAPFISKTVVIGGTTIDGNSFSIADDGNGNLQLITVNAVTSVPAQTTNPAVPGMYNINTGNPGLINPTNIGTVNYVAGNIAFTLSLPLQQGTTLTVWCSQYQPGRPYSVLFWNNTFYVRPIPKLIHQITVETYLSPVQFMLTSDSPILNQWVQYIAYGVSCEILRQRQDMEGVQNLMEGFMRQEALVLERQGTEEINCRNKNIYSGAQSNLGWNSGWMQGWY